MSKRIEFKRSPFRLIIYLIATNVFLAIAFLVTGTHFDSGWIFIAVINIIYLATDVFKPVKIIIDTGLSTLELRYLLRPLQKNKVFLLREIACTFNYELIARAAKGKVLKIIHDNKPVAELLAGDNGWDENSVNQIFELLDNKDSV